MNLIGSWTAERVLSEYRHANRPPRRRTGCGEPFDHLVDRRKRRQDIEGVSGERAHDIIEMRGSGQIDDRMINSRTIDVPRCPKVVASHQRTRKSIESNLAPFRHARQALDWSRPDPHGFPIDRDAIERWSVFLHRARCKTLAAVPPANLLKPREVAASTRLRFGRQTEMHGQAIDVEKKHLLAGNRADDWN